MHGRSVIVLVIDGLRAGALGSYGAAWCETPALDRLASRSLLLDHALTDRPELQSYCRAVWQGRHALAGDVPEGPTLLSQLDEADVATRLITDDPLVAGHPLAADFEERIQIDIDDALTPAQELEDTQLGQFFAGVIDALEELDPSQRHLQWIHSRGLTGVWDAPLELRNSLADEEDPPPPQSTEVPKLRLPEDYDPDFLLGITQAYTGQVMLLDRCLGIFLDYLQQRGLLDETLLVLTAPRGFGLGEHQVVGLHDSLLHEESLHVPWLISLSEGQSAMVRSQALVQPSDFAPTIADWLQVGDFTSGGGKSLLPLVADEDLVLRDHVCMATQHARAIRTPAWFLCPSEEEQRFALYTKPDDRWEANDIADRATEIAESLREALTVFEKAAQADTLHELSPLEESLLTPPE